MPSADAFSGEITVTMVYEAIADVLDPELDESLVKLGFIDHVQVDEGTVTIAFKLPTYWCAPNFAYLMAADLRAKVLAIPGVHTARILLLDHCTDEEISTSINAGKSFTEAFPDEAEDNLEELRLIFLRKGFLMRQDTLLRKLQKAGVDEATLLSLRVAHLSIDEATQRATITTPQQVVHLERMAHTAQAYLRRAALLGLHHQAQDLLFSDEHGQPIRPGELQHYLRQSRSVRMNIMFNTVFCSDMFQTRYGSGEKKS
ncbi:MAG TPA: iron-sulfur cluster assembly protein [Ktedonobacteraceae bacterium]|nr:iron-sulfur cluster assembly protein [Ktedonobacteraceae bacterium]